MKRMRWRVLSLALWLTLLFNIERLDGDHPSPLTLAPYVYVLAAVAVTVFLLAPLSRRAMPLALAGLLTLYVVMKVSSPTPFFSGVGKYLTITEVGALLITAELSWLVGHSLLDFVEAVESISLPEGRARLMSYAKVQERLHAEMGRARRQQRPISVALIELDPATLGAALHQAVRDVQTMLVKRYVQVRFGLFMSNHIRGTDVIAHDTQAGRFLLLAPDAPSDQTAAMLARLSRMAEDQMGLRFRYSIADFPKTALTSEALLCKVAEALEHPPAEHAAAAEDDPREASQGGGAEVYATLPVMSESSLEERR